MGKIGRQDAEKTEKHEQNHSALPFTLRRIMACIFPS
tara:strand:- start:142 stop:252 length:111 start_codon:yes stop_codon:yes gene_type:complete